MFLPKRLFFKHHPNLSSLTSSAPQVPEDLPTEQLAGNAAVDGAVVDAGLETDAEQNVPVTEASEEGGEQPGGLETGDGVHDASDIADGGAALDTVEVPAVDDQLPEMAPAGQLPLATVDDVIEVSVVTPRGHCNGQRLQREM